jgi:hypothetical protein
MMTMTDTNNQIPHANRFASEVAINAVVLRHFPLLNGFLPAHFALARFHHMACTYITHPSQVSISSPLFLPRLLVGCTYQNNTFLSLVLSVWHTSVERTRERR